MRTQGIVSRLLAPSIVALLAACPVAAGDKDCDGNNGGHRGRCVFCPHCGDACYPTVTKEMETKTCWNVETKKICIPRVRFPWESTCCDKGCGKDGCVAPKCGRTKCVNVLMKHEYECSTCKYSWDVDSYKTGNEIKAPAGKPVDTSVPAPPQVEASLRRVAPVPFDQRGTSPPAKRTYAEILTSFFK